MEKALDIGYVEDSSFGDPLDYIFNPRSVAVIGASNKIGSWGFGVISRLLANPKRKAYPVNSKASEVLGAKAYRKITDIPYPIDFAVLAVPPHKTPEVMRECVEKGVKAALVISGGLAESGDEGAKLEKELLEIAEDGGIRFVGPNSMGHVNVHSDFSTLSWIEEIKPGPIAFLSQSGTYGQRVVRTGIHRGIGFSKFVSDGNEADIHFEDFVEYLAKDEETRIITAYVEGLRDGRRFFELAKEITREKPVIIMKSGATEGSAKAAMSHTASLSGSDKICDAMFRQSGVIRVVDEDEMFDVASALLSLPLPKGKRVGILTEGGGMGVVMAEACEKMGLELVPFSPATTEKLESILPTRCSCNNPTDITDMVTSGNLVIFSCLWAILEDPNVDAVMLLGGLGASSYFPTILNKLERVSPSDKEAFQEMIDSLRDQEMTNLSIMRKKVTKLQKPLFYVNLLPRVMEEPECFDVLREKGIPVFTNPRRAAKALRLLVNYNDYLRGTG